VNLTQLPQPTEQIRTSEQLSNAAKNMANAGLGPAADFLAESIRQVLSVPAPLTVSVGPKGPRIRAATRAQPGAPPRLVTGRLRGGVFSRQADDSSWDVGIENVPYAARLEDELGHRYIEPTIRRDIERLSVIVGEAIEARRAD
jgi:hypothetical protein